MSDTPEQRPVDEPGPLPFQKENPPEEKRDSSYFDNLNEDSSSEEDRASDYVKKLREKQGYMPLAEHLEELRWRLLRAIGWITGFSLIAFLFYDFFWRIVMEPLAPLIKNSVDKKIVVKVITTQLSDFMVVQFKIAAVAGAIMALPVILVEFWRFVLPALEKKFRVFGSGIIVSSIFLFWTGALLGRFLIWPYVTDFMVSDWAPPPLVIGDQTIQPEVHLILDDYLGFFFTFHFGFGLAFQLPVVSVILAAIGVLKSGLYFASWRVSVLIIAIVSAVVTPPDVVSMMAMMVPLLILYYFSGFLVWVVEKTKKSGEDETQEE